MKLNLSVDLGRNIGFAHEMASKFDPNWKFPRKPELTKSQFLKQLVGHEHHDYFKLLFEYDNIETLDELCEFVRLRINPEELYELSEIVGKSTNKANATFDHVKTWIGYFELLHESDLNDPRFLSLCNWYLKFTGSLRILISNVPNAGFGLFTKKGYKSGDIICYYGGNLSRRNYNEFLDFGENENELNAYSMTIKDDGLFDGWVVDAKRFFCIYEVGRFPNGFPWKKLPKEVEDTFINNCQYEVREHPFLENYPIIAIVATRTILPYSEIYADYGKNYGWESIYSEKEEELEEDLEDDPKFTKERMKLYLSKFGKQVNVDVLYRYFLKQSIIVRNKKGFVGVFDPLSFDKYDPYKLGRSFWKGFLNSFQ
jgi:hypothetical protein